MKTPAPFTYAVEISHSNQSLDECRRVAVEFLRARGYQHEVALERPAKLVVKFTTMDEASSFYWSVNGRFVGTPSMPFELAKGDL